MSNGDHRDRFFYSTLTLLIYYYIIRECSANWLNGLSFWEVYIISSEGSRWGVRTSISKDTYSNVWVFQRVGWSWPPAPTPPLHPTCRSDPVLTIRMILPWSMILSITLAFPTRFSYSGINVKKTKTNNIHVYTSICILLVQKCWSWMSKGKSKFKSKCITNACDSLMSLETMCILF